MVKVMSTVDVGIEEEQRDPEEDGAAAEALGCTWTYEERSRPFDLLGVKSDHFILGIGK